VASKPLVTHPKDDAVRLAGARARDRYAQTPSHGRMWKEDVVLEGWSARGHFLLPTVVRKGEAP